jgi:hypothetical protein
LLRQALIRRRASLTAAASIGAYFVVLASIGGRDAWTRLGVPTIRPGFLDLRGVTSAWDCTRRGIAVLPKNPCDPLQRPSDYPHLWLLPWHLGLGQDDTFVIGIVLAVLFLVAAIAVLPAGAGVMAGLAYAAVVCSPAVMLGVERGNVDIFLFALVVAAVLAWRRGLPGLVVGDAILFLTAILKFFPIFAVGFLLRRATKPAVRSAVAIVCAFAIDLFVTRNDIRAIFRAGFEEDTFSYGVRRTSEWVGAIAGGTSLRAWDIVLVVIAVASAFLLQRRLRPSAASVRELDLFWAGACIYVGSYATVRNFDYRLVFLLLIVPQLLQWARERQPLAFVTLAALLGATWLDVWSSMPGVHVILDWWNRVTAVGANAQALPVAVICQFVLFGTLVAWLVAIAPLTRSSSHERR